MAHCEGQIVGTQLRIRICQQYLSMLLFLLLDLLNDALQCVLILACVSSVFLGLLY